MGTHNIDPNTGFVKFTPSKEESNQLDLRRDIKHIKEEINKLNEDMQELKAILYKILSLL